MSVKEREIFWLGQDSFLCKAATIILSLDKIPLITLVTLLTFVANRPFALAGRQVVCLPPVLT